MGLCKVNTPFIQPEASPRHAPFPPLTRPPFLLSGNSMRSNSPEPVPQNAEFANLKYEDLKFIATLGMGGFGRVELVSYGKTVLKRRIWASAA